MRKTSQDGGDATSATSGVENEIKKPKSCLLLEFKSKKVGKRTAPNLSEESDDAVVEPLLQKTDKAIQSAKYFAKAKADTVKEISKLFNDKKAQSASTSGFGTTESLISEKDQAISKPTVSTSAPLHNYMNTNVFHSHENSKANGTTKTQVLVEIDASKQSGYNPSPLIFTTAKIHTDGKSKHMEPVQMTPAPILSTIEVSVSKGSTISNEKKISNGTTVMNTVFIDSHVNENAKENTVHISSSKFKQSKDLVLTDNNSNPTTSLPAKEKTHTEVGSLVHTIEKTKDDIANISKSNNMTPVAQSKEVISNAANSSKPITSLSNHPMKSSLSSEASKSTFIDVKNKQDHKETKKLVDEPRILMSESKLKSTISENTKLICSVTTTKPLPEPIKTVEPLPKLPLSIQSNKTDAIKSEKNKCSLEQDIKEKNTEIIGPQPLQIINIKSPVKKDHVTKPNTVTSKSFQQNSTQIEKSTSKVLENVNDPNAKALSSSTKVPAQSKVTDNKLSKEIDKSPKPCANEITKSTSKISLNNTASPSTNKIPTSALTSKPAPNVSHSNVISSITQSSNKAINNYSPNNVKTMNATVATSATTNVSVSSVKAQSISSKAATTTVNPKSTSVTTAKSTTKASAASIKSSSTIKSSQISPTSAAKQSTVIAKTASVKPPPLASTKTPQVNTINPGVTAPIAKSAVSKIAQVSTSAGQKNVSTPTLPPSSTSSDSSNKTKTPESNKKAGPKPSDHAKNVKVSKA